MTSRTSQKLIIAAVGLCLIALAAAHAKTLFFIGHVPGERNVKVGFEVRGPAENGHIKFAKAHVEDFLIAGAKITRGGLQGGAEGDQRGRFPL